MEYVETYTLMNVATFKGAVSLNSGKVVESYASVKKHIRTMGDFAGVPARWSMFRDRRGHIVEKCVFEHQRAGVRHTDVVWVKRGVRWS